MSDMCALSVFHPIMDLLQLKHIPPSAAEQISNKNVFTSNGSQVTKNPVTHEADTLLNRIVHLSVLDCGIKVLTGTNEVKLKVPN